MELTKHSNHRNTKYLKWLRTQPCVVSAQKAQCAHHVRLGTNGGSSLKPSDYFCIPLLNEYHTTGPRALHLIGEDTFFQEFKLSHTRLFIHFLKEYLAQEHDTLIQLEDQSELWLINYLIELVESKGPSIERVKRTKKKVELDTYAQKSRDQKKLKDKELRAKLKENKSISPNQKKSFKGNEFYEKAKEQKREQDKVLREKLKKSQKTNNKTFGNDENDFKLKQKELMAKHRKEQYQKAKEFRKRTQL